MIMHRIVATTFRPVRLLLSVVIISVHAHDEHEHDMQMPLDYVKFPYQAAYYPGDNEGMTAIGV